MVAYFPPFRVSANRCQTPSGRWLHWLAGFLLGIALPASDAASAAQDTVLRIGVLAARPKEDTLARWQPTADYLTEKVKGARFTVQAYNHAELEQVILAKRIDFILTNPAHFLTVARRNGILPMITLAEQEHGKAIESFGGVILVRADRQDLKTIADLKGKTVATPDQQSFGGYMVQVHELKRLGLRVPEDVRVLMTGMPHDAAFQAMLDGRADAAFIRTGVLEDLQRAGTVAADSLRVLNRQEHPGFPYAISTPLYPQWPLAAMPATDRETVRQVAAALLMMPRGHPAATAGGYAYWMISADYGPVRDVLESLRVPPYDKEPTFTREDVINRYGPELMPFLLLGLALALLVTLLVLVSRRLGAERLVTAGQNEEKRRLLAALGEGVFGVDGLNQCTFINPAALDMLGYTVEEVLGKDMHHLLHRQRQDGRDYPVADCPVVMTLNDGKPRKADDQWLLRKNGSGFPAAMTITPIAEGEERSGAVVVFRDLTEQKRLEGELLRLATTDFLTGLPNRRRFLEQLDLELARLRRGLVSSTALLMLDLDHFKVVNDQYGHPAGDSVLQRFSALLRESLRRVDTAGRLGGEEFAVILAGSSMESACAYAERFREQVEATSFRSEHGPLRVTVSIGVTILSDLDTSSASALARADLALYRAKAGGRNRMETAQVPMA